MRYVAFACHAPLPDFCAVVLRPALHARLAAASVAAVAAVAATSFGGTWLPASKLVRLVV